MAQPKLPTRVREALDKGGWQEYISTENVANYRRPTGSVLIYPSPGYKGRFAVMIEHNDTRPNISDSMDQDTLIKYLTTDDKD